ncbi:hypothetical protein [Nonomuraea rubra]
MTAGDTCQIAPGPTAETITPARRRHGVARITYTAAPGAAVVVDAATR